MGEAPAPAPPASTPLAAREKPSLRRWLATHKLQACALCFMVMSIALYFLVQAFAAGGALGAALAVGFFCLFCYCCDQGYRVYASEGFWRTYAFYKALGPLVAEWKLLEKRAKLEKWGDDRARKAYDAFHVRPPRARRPRARARVSCAEVPRARARRRSALKSAECLNVQVIRI